MTMMPMIQAPDQAARDAALDIQSSFIVQAPAGSGKTELLTQRFLSLLAYGCTMPEQIVALTFTKKAAAEMRQRIIRALELAQGEAPQLPHALKTYELAKSVLARDRLFNWQLYEHPQRLRIQTIDSFCRSIAQLVPAFSGISALTNTTDHPEFYYQQAAQALLSSWDDLTEENKFALQTLSLHCNNDYGKLEKLLMGLLSKREQWLDNVISSHKNKNQIRAYLERNLKHVIEEKLQTINALFPASFKQELLSLFRFAAEAIIQQPEHKLHQYFSACVNLTEWPKAHINDLPVWKAIFHLLFTNEAQWRKQLTIREGFPSATSTKIKEQKEFFNTQKAHCLQLIADLSENELLTLALIEINHLPATTYTEQQWEVLAALISLLPLLCGHLLAAFQTDQRVDFIEISQSALHVLQHNQGVSELNMQLEQQIQHILIDEFQDTSILQFRILEALVSEWIPNDGHTLFLVGDPMQSIYRFRAAEVSLFIVVREQGIGNLEIKPLQLTANFRSEEALIRWWNEAFQIIFPQQADRYLGAINFSPSSAMINTNFPPPVFNTYACIDEHNEAQQLVTTIKQLQFNYPDHTIAVLARTRSQLKAILQQFNLENLDYHAYDIAPLHASSVIHDLYSLTRALLHFGDRVAWLAILRAPWCGLSLHELHQLANTPECATLWKAIQYHVAQKTFNESAHARLLKIVEVITHALQTRAHLPFTSWIRKTWYALDGDCYLSTHDLVNAQAYFQALLKFSEAEDLHDFHAFDAYLKKAYQSQLSTLDCRLHVMTIHKAKGLEFDHVLIPGLERKQRSKDVPLLNWLERVNYNHEIELLFAPIAPLGQKNSDPISAYLLHEQQKKDNFEIDRLLYVAMTRAKKSLYLFAKHIKQQAAPSSFLYRLKNYFAHTELNKETIKQTENPYQLSFNEHTAERFSYIQRLPDQYFIKQTSKKTPELNISDIFTPLSMHQSTMDSYHLLHDLMHLERQAGIIFHRLLAHIAASSNHSYEQFNSINWQALTTKLQLQGFSLEESQKILHITQDALNKMLDDERGRWILSPAHNAIRTELQLEGRYGQNNIAIAIDRTFIDHEGIRWIIDYKLSTPFSNEEHEQFISRVRGQHIEKMQAYSSIIQQYEDRPVRLGLYFPRCQLWDEWEA